MSRLLPLLPLLLPMFLLLPLLSLLLPMSRLLPLLLPMCLLLPLLSPVAAALPTVFHLVGPLLPPLLLNSAASVVAHMGRR